MGDSELRVRITGISDQYERTIGQLETAHKRFFGSVDAGNKLSAASTDALAIRIKGLERALNEASSSGKANADSLAQGRRQLEAWRDELDKANSAARENLKVQNDQRKALSEGGIVWRGWGDAAQDAAGKYGKYVAQVAVGSIILREAIAITRDFLRVTDTGELDVYSKWVTSGIKWLKDYKAARVDAAAAAIQITGSVMRDDGAAADEWIRGYQLRWSDIMKSVTSQADKIASTTYGPAKPTDAQILQAQALTTLREQTEAVERQEKAAAALKRQWQEINSVLKEQVRELKARDPFTLSASKPWLFSNQQIAGVYSTASRQLEAGLWDAASGIGATVGYASMDPAQREKALGEIRKVNDDFIAKWRSSGDYVAGTLAGTLADFVRNGGKGFGEIASYYISDKAATAIGTGISAFLTPTKNADGTWSAAGRTYQSKEEAAGALGKYQGAMDIGMSGVAGYGAGYSGTPGSRTSSLIGTGTAAASIAAAHPYIAAAMVLANIVGSALGAQQRQSEYKWVDPNIVGGRVSPWFNEDVGAGERAKVIADIQDRYDWSRNSTVSILQSLGVQPKAGTFGDIDARIQDNPSANMMKHVGEWQTYTLPGLVFGQGRTQMREGFADLGLSNAKFDALYRTMSALSPEKMFEAFSQLAQLLSTFKENFTFFDARNGQGQNTSWFTAMLEEQREQSKSFAEVMRGDFDQILTMASYLDDYVGAEQISQARQIADLMTEARNKEKEALREILAAQKAVDDQRQSFRDRYTVMGMVKADGTPDYEKQAQYYRGRADDSLRVISLAKTGAEAQQGYSQFVDWLDKIVAAGYSQSQKTGESYRLWAIEQERLAAANFQTRTDLLGKAVQTENARFMEEFRPYFDGFTTLLGSTTKPITDIRDRFDDLDPPMRRFRDNVDNANAAIEGLVSYVATVTGRY